MTTSTKGSIPRSRVASTSSASAAPSPTHLTMMSTASAPAPSARIDLRRVDDEILAQNGQGDGGARRREIGERAVEPFLVGEYAHHRRAARLRRPLRARAGPSARERGPADGDRNLISAISRSGAPAGRRSAAQPRRARGHPAGACGGVDHREGSHLLRFLGEDVERSPIRFQPARARSAAARQRSKVGKGAPDDRARSTRVAASFGVSLLGDHHRCGSVEHIAYARRMGLAAKDCLDRLWHSRPRRRRERIGADPLQAEVVGVDHALADAVAVELGDARRDRRGSPRRCPPRPTPPKLACVPSTRSVSAITGRSLSS